MRILYISNDPGIPFNGRKGCSTHVRETCYSLIEAGHEVMIATPAIGTDKFSREINFRKPPYLTSKKLGFDLRLYLSGFFQWGFYKRLIKEFNPDFIYERYSLYSWPGDKIERKFRIPRIVEINAPLAKQHGDRLRFPYFAQKLEEKILKNAGSVIAISEPLKKYLVEIGVAEEKIDVMPIAVDPELFNPKTSGDEIRKKYGLSGKTVFGYVGAFNYYHGIENLYEIAEHFKKNKMNAALLIVGGEDYKVEKHIQKVKEANLGEYVIFTGSVSYEVLPKHVSAMDITLIFGHTNYASPTKLFEYASMKKPIIAPDFPPIRNIIGTCGDAAHYIFNPDDTKDLIEKVDYLYHNPDKRNLLVESVYQKVLNNHTWESNTKKVLDIYERIKKLPYYSSKHF